MLRHLEAGGPGSGFAADTGDGLGRRVVYKNARHQARADQHLGLGCACQGVEGRSSSFRDVDGGAGVALGDLVGGAVSAFSSASSAASARW